MTEAKKTRTDLATENERLRASLRKIREHVARVDSGEPATAYYQLGALDAEAAIALGEAIFPGETA